MSLAPQVQAVCGMHSPAEEGLRGPQVALLFADPERELKSLEMVKRSAQAEVFLLAATLLRGERGPHEALRPVGRSRRPAGLTEGPARETGRANGTTGGRFRVEGTHMTFDSPAARGLIDLRGLRCERLESVGTGAPLRFAQGAALVRLTANGREIGPDAWQVTAVEVRGTTEATVVAQVQTPAVHLGVRAEFSLVAEELQWTLQVENRGGIEYLHLMDWGSHPEHGRVYGRSGDYAPWEAWKGGAPSFAAALAEASTQGVPVGLYVEGYLLEERGKLGSAQGKAWQVLGADGKGLYWPGATEMFICPYATAWQNVQVDTYCQLLDRFQPRLCAANGS